MGSMADHDFAKKKSDRKFGRLAEKVKKTHAHWSGWRQHVIMSARPDISSPTPGENP